jgi:hypothetical protein
MENKQVTGIVQAVKNETKSVLIADQWYSGQYTYKGEMPKKGETIDMTTISSVSKANGKTYWNIADIKVIKANTQTFDGKDRTNVDAGNCLAKASDAFIAGKFTTILEAQKSYIGAFKEGVRLLNSTEKEIVQSAIKEQPIDEEGMYV